MKRVQAFGAGVQSVTMLRMILAGELDPVDRVIFADTQAEPKHVYEVVERESKLCDLAGIPFDVVTYRSLAEETNKTVKVPLFTVDAKGKAGMLLRNCTSRFKIEPIEKRIRELGWKAEGCEQYMGISTDEIQRVKPSRKKYITLRYPLIEKNMRRGDCEAYLRRIGVEAAKSACVFCPYRSATNWRAVRAVEADWADAVRYDLAIRDVRSEHGIKCYVHVSRKPLEEAVSDSANEPSLFDDECAGYCGV